MIKRLGKLLSYSLLATGCTFALQAVATRILSPSEFGVFARWLTDINYFGLFLVLGLDNAILFFSKKPGDFASNMGRNIVSFAGIATLAILFFEFRDSLGIYHASLVGAVFCFAVYQSINAFNQYSEEFGAYGFFTFFRPFALLLPFFVMFILGDAYNANTALIVYSVVSFFSVVCIAGFALRKSGIAIPSPLWRLDYYMYGAKSMFNTLLAVTLYTSTIYCLDYLSGKEAVGVFFIASAISRLAWVLPDAVGNILYPKYLKADLDSNADVLSLTYAYAQVVFLANIAAFVLFLFVGRIALDLVFGDKYTNSFVPILILFIGNQGMVYYKILGRYLASRNQWGYLRAALAAAISINIVLNFVLIPKFGINGAAIATATSFWVCGLAVSFSSKTAFLEFLNLYSLLRGRLRWGKK